MQADSQRESKSGLVPPTDVRFGMRALLTMMGAVAFASAVVGFVFRKLPDMARTRAVVILAIVAALLIGCALHVGQTRRRLERLAGMPRFVLAPHSDLFPTAPRITATIAGVASLLVSVALMVFVGTLVWEAPSGRSSLSVVWYGFYALAAASFGISMLWWNRSVRLGDDGVLVRHMFVPWEDSARHYWDGCYRDVMVLEWQKHGRVAVWVPKGLPNGRGSLYCGSYAACTRRECPTADARI